MNLDARLPVLAAAIGVAVLALGGGFLLLGRGQSSSSAATQEIKPLHPVKKHVAPKTAAPAKKVAAKHVASTPKVMPKPKPAAKVVSKPKAKPAPTVIDGMPATLALALRAHPVVVVSLFTPGSSVDRIATDEARHGASLARAGYVAFSVADEKIVRPLTSLLTGAPTPADRVLDGPATLIFQRPNTLFVRFNGFADRDTVAQAVANAAALAQ